MITIRAYANSDDALIVWKSPRIANCVGFALERKTKNTTTFVTNRIGFEGQHAQPGEHRPSSEWPFQRYSWTDHAVNKGETVQYRAIPVMKGTSPYTTTLDRSQASDWSAPVTLDGVALDVECYFTRGYIMSQFVRTAVKGDLSRENLKHFKDSLGTQKNAMRKFLYGDLGARLLELLATLDATDHVYLALYELGDQELLRALERLGKRVHIVLAPGSVKKKGEDENAEARDRLHRAGAEVFDRMLWSKGLGHNKFMVVASGKTPKLVWTGSTNWMTSALCTQINNGVVIHNPSIAKEYMDQWKRLRDAGSDFPKTLVSANDKMKVGKNYNIWFSRTSSGADLDYCRELIANAKHSIQFLMFEPGPAGLQNEILARKGDLFVHGVINSINQNKGQKSAETNVNVTLTSPEKHHHFNLDVVQPEGIHRDDLAWWGEEVTRKLFLTMGGGVFGFAIIHSKVIVIDALGENPIVITGSHNMGASASRKNDENLIVIRGNPALARKYAVHVQSVYDHFRWRSYLAEEEQPYNGLRMDDKWQKISPAKQRDLDFWMEDLASTDGSSVKHTAIPSPAVHPRATRSKSRARH